MTPTTRRSKWRIALRWLGAVAVLVVVALVVWSVVWYRRAHAPAPLVLSKETTFITGPVRADGSINYLAALNKRYSQGVTRDNNGAVLFWRAMGPSAIESQDRAEFFKQLGIVPLPEKGDYFVSLDKFVEQLGEQANLDEQILLSPTAAKDLWAQRLTVAMTRPWSREEFPVLAQWLEANEKPLALLTEASQRPRWFNPLVSNDGIILAVRMAWIEPIGEIARAFLARAMLRAHEGRTDAACDDVKTSACLARLVAQGPTLVDGLTGIKIETMAFNALPVLLQHGVLMADQIGQLRNDYSDRKPLPAMVEKLDICERLSTINMTVRVARSKPGTLQTMAEEIGPGKLPVIELASFATIDWNLVLRFINGWYDRAVAAHRLPERSVRHAQLQQMMDELSDLAENSKDVRTLLSSMTTDPQQAASERVGQILVAILMPDVAAVNKADELSAMRFQMIELAFALAAYRAEHESYPDTLAELKPDYLADIPLDVFSSAALHYETQEGRYLLYSVGINGVDDGGSKDGSQNHDDLVIRIPAEKKLEGTAP